MRVVFEGICESEGRYASMNEEEVDEVSKRRYEKNKSSES